MQDELLYEGRKALSEGRWKAARIFLEKALEAGNAPEVYEELARAYWWLNDIPSVFEYRTKAYELFLERNDRIGAARNAAWLGDDYLSIKGEFAIANGWVQRAENLVTDIGDSWELALAKMLKARLAFMSEKSNENAFRLIEESLSISKRVGSVDAEMIAGGFKGFILITEGKISEGMALLDEATLLATTANAKDVNLVTITCCFLIGACEKIRDYERAGQWCNKVKEICRRWHFDSMFAYCRIQYASVLIWKGNWQEAEEELVAAMEAVKKISGLQPASAGIPLVKLADLKRRQGKWEEADRLLEKVDIIRIKLLTCATFAFDKGEYASAAGMVERYLRQIPDKGKTEKIAGLELLLRVYAKQQRLEEAAIILNELTQIAEAINTLPLKATALCGKGILHDASGNYVFAKHDLEDAIDLYEQIKSPFEAAHAHAVLSEVLIKLNQYGQAEAELNAALKDFQMVGAQKEIEKTKQLLKDLHKAHTGQIPKERCEFTGRELEILRLIAEGKNNEEIADQLFLSVRTVEKHLTNLYFKMGVSGKSARAFAASYAIKHKLLFS
jgi:DNA-binding NarL/FixJ family response regulator